MLTIVFRCYLGLHVPENLGKAASTTTGPNDPIQVVWVVFYLFITIQISLETLLHLER